MEIDETALAAAQGKAADHGWIFSTAQHRKDLEAIITAYLAALPKPEQGRDRIAVAVSGDGFEAMVAEGEWMNESAWNWLEERAGRGPFARAIVRCNLPRPAEVDGEVEAVLDGFRDGFGWAP